MAQYNGLTFAAWLATQADRDDPVGDLALDVGRDPNFPILAGLDGLHAYLERVGAELEAIAAFNDAWAEFAR